MKPLLVALCLASVVVAQEKSRGRVKARDDQRLVIGVMTPKGNATLLADSIRQSRDGTIVYLRGHVSIVTGNPAPAPPTVIDVDEADIHVDTGEIEARRAVSGVGR